MASNIMFPSGQYGNTQQPQKMLYQQAAAYEKQFPYHRNNPAEEAVLAEHQTEIIALIDRFRKEGVSAASAESLDALGHILKLVRRCSEYKLSHARDCAFAFDYSHWALEQYKRFFAKKPPETLLEDIIKITNHLGFAYYFSHEANPQNQSYLETARKLLCSSLQMNGSSFPRLRGYAYCISGQIETLDGDISKAREYFTKSYLLYTHQSEEGMLSREKALNDLEEMIRLLDEEMDKEKRSDLYQRAIVIGYYADNEVRDKGYDFSEKCYGLCTTFVHNYWNGDTLQVGDLYTRLGNLLKRADRGPEAVESYRKSLSIYERISPHHDRTLELRKLVSSSP